MKKTIVVQPSVPVTRDEYLCDHCQAVMNSYEHWQGQCFVCGKDTCYGCRQHYPFGWLDYQYWSPEDQPPICKSCLVPMEPILKALNEAETEYENKTAPFHAEGIKWIKQIWEAKKEKKR